MFNRDYSFWGTHARKVEMLTEAFSENNTFKMFQRNVDVYMLAPIIGFIFGKYVDEDKKDGMERKIALSQLSPNIKILEYNYRLVMLLDKKHESDLQKRIDKAFRHYNTPEAMVDEKMYESYVRGGIDIIYEKTLEQASDENDYINKIYDFLEDFNERYYNNIDNNNSIVELARD